MPLSVSNDNYYYTTKTQELVDTQTSSIYTYKVKKQANNEQISSNYIFNVKKKFKNAQLNSNYSYKTTKKEVLKTINSKYLYKTKRRFSGVIIDFEENNDDLIPYTTYVKKDKVVYSKSFGYPVLFDKRISDSIPMYSVSKDFLRKVIYAIENNRLDIF